MLDLRYDPRRDTIRDPRWVVTIRDYDTIRDGLSDSASMYTLSRFIREGLPDCASEVRQLDLEQ